MQLLSYDVIGFRAAAAVPGLRVGHPTIVTGANDAGKTACLDALRVLLEGRAVAYDDRTRGIDSDAPELVAEDGRLATTSVEGEFRLSAAEQEALALPEVVRIRRIHRYASAPQYELQRVVPTDERLRGLEALGLAELRTRAEELGVPVEGHQGRKETFLGPLLVRAVEAPTVTDWQVAPRDVISHLPRLLYYSSMQEPAPENEIHQVLRTVFAGFVEDPDVRGTITEVEGTLRARLTESAEELRAHILARCPELGEIRITPNVSFREGFPNVDVAAGPDAASAVALAYSGAGRRRRISLAVWEWAREIFEHGNGEPANLVVAYDEPDTHLDYANQRILVELLREQSAIPGVAVFVATHSLNLIDKVDVSDVLHFRLDDGRTNAVRLMSNAHGDIDQHLAQITASMGLRNSVLLHERCFLAVEGPTEGQVLPLLFRIATGLALQSAGIALIVGNSNRGALDVARFLNDHGRTVRFLIDKDSVAPGSGHMFTPEALHRVGIADHQMHLVGNPRELEDLFTDEQWADAANDCWPRTDGRAWVAADFAELRDDGKFSDKVERMVRPNSESAPTSKPGYALEVARRSTDRADVPAQLADAFQQIAAAANAM